MNKSKFLKKSLAALLAVMLVVAMIPLSAAAAELPEYPLPNMTRLYINGNDVKLEDGVFAADIGSSATQVELRADNGSLGTPGVNEATLEVMKPGSVTSKPVTVAASDFTFADYATEEGDVVTLNLRMTSAGNKNSYKDFSIKLTRTTQGTTAELESATPIQSTGLYTADIGDHVINVTVARKAGSTGGSTNPSITLKAKDKAVINGTVSGQTLTAGNTVRVDKVADNETITITSQSGNNTAEWTFKVTYVDALDSLSVNGVAGVISDKVTNDSGNLYNTLTPDNIPDTVTVSLDSDVFNDSLGNPIANPNTKKLPVSLAVKGNVPYVYINSSDAATSYNDATGSATSTKVNAGEEYAFEVPLDTDNPTKVSLWVPSGAWGNTAAQTDFQKYILVIELKRSDNTAIESVTIMDEIATIDGEKIHAVLPDKKADGTTTINLSAIDNIKIVTADTVTSVYMDSTDNPPVNFFKAGSPSGGKITWEMDTTANSNAGTTANLSSPKIITVTAQNGEIQQYTISAEKDTNRTLAELNSITLQDPAGNNYTGTISGHKVTFSNIPYMTTSLADWKVFVEPNSSATAKVGTTTIVNGTKQANLLFTDVNIKAAPNSTRTYTGDTLCIENKNDRAVFTNYETELVLVAPKTGNTLSSLKVSAQTATPVGVKNNVVYDKITTANTITAEIKNDFATNTGTITFKQPFSLSTSNVNNTNLYDVITELSTNNGGIAFFGNLDVATAGAEAVRIDSGVDSVLGAKGGQMSALANDKETFSSSYFDIANGYFKTNKSVRIVVLPEEIARQVIVDPYHGASGTTINYIANGSGTGNRLSYGTVYSLEEEVLDPEHNADLKSIAIGDTTLTINGDKITGTLPYSKTAATAAATSLDTAKSQFVKFETVSNFAYWENFNSEGKKDGAVAAPNTDNLKLIFTREADHKVNVYVYDGTAANNAQLNDDTLNAFTVKAEDSLDANADDSTHKYTFDLKWADPNTEAKITSFSLAGRSGSISGQNVTVPVPYLTDVKGLIPTFTLSSGATMKLDDASAGVIESEKTTLDFSNPVKVIVTSEDGLHSEHYTITVTEGEMFTDVNSNHWFYDEVLKAATEKWIEGRGDGTFDPWANMTRADFANIIAKMQGFNADDYKDSRFADVPSSHYASAAIAFCADKEYIKGVGDNNFDPGAYITREQAAAIICRVKGYAEESGNTSYGDDAKISGWAKGYVKAATTHQVMQGDGTNFNPQNNLRRCEGAAILVRSASK